jgi:hypothetical protein
MRYIRIDRDSLKVEVVDVKDKKRVFVPIKSDRSGSAPTDMLDYTVYFDVLYPIVEAPNRKRGIHIRYKLPEPDPMVDRLGRHYVGGTSTGTYLGYDQNVVAGRPRQTSREAACAAAEFDLHGKAADAQFTNPSGVFLDQIQHRWPPAISILSWS